MTAVFTFSLQQCQIAANNLDGTFGTAYQLESTKTLTMAQKFVSDKARGNARITALAAQTESYDVGLDTAGIDNDALAVLFGTTAVDSNDGNVLSISNILTPYFGLVGQAFPDGDGDFLVFFPYCKVTSDMNFKFEYGKIVVPQFKAEAIEGSAFPYIVNYYERPDGEAAITFPPQIPA